ncbi:MAG: histidine kinase [Opitutaceae bacterium]|nr:histidine kinase [Opitutaceae bacterium]
MLALTLILTLALGVSFYRLRQNRLNLIALEQAVKEGRRFLLEEGQGHSGAEWADLCNAVNINSEELERLQQYRTSQLAQLEATLGSLQEAVLIVDGGNRILLANQALQSIFPEAQNIFNQRVELVLQSREFLDYVETVRKSRAVAQHPIEFGQGNDSVWAEVTGTLIPALEGQKDEWALFVLHDITRQRKLETLRKDFVANVSHELRTPLSVIKGYVETLVDDHQTMAIEDRERFLITIERHTERLNSLLEDLLALSRLESVNPGLSRESASLSGFIDELVEDYRGRPSCQAHHLNVSVDQDVDQFLIDPLKITQVFENLLENALKYTPAGSHVYISAKMRDRVVEISVRDSGPGIPAEDLPHIFERFYRVDKGRSREKGGTGLGLSIVKHIIQLHGGRVWAESEPGEGTAVFFTLPASM